MTFLPPLWGPVSTHLLANAMKRRASMTFPAIGLGSGRLLLPYLLKSKENARDVCPFRRKNSKVGTGL
jgi:hypothetical protein